MVNKAEFIEALTTRFEDRKTAANALEQIVDEIQRTVAKGDRVAITGFGVFEKRVRAARTARNPRTGESVKVKKTAVPAFRPGTGFKTVVADPKKLPKTPGAKATTKATAVGASRGPAPAAKKATAKKAAPAKKAAAKKAAPAKKAAAKKAPARKAPARKR
ncbi:HU family DNA-binding protein [Fodinicola acaciae]|uniref:HU family DNA-binding protein n=1 Tax=Fodinicola acaciae TaxID=2681555 RepID=UPI0024844029|nr:HU family DNA-binding protein [Fodinicola acaciae]